VYPEGDSAAQSSVQTSYENVNDIAGDQIERLPTRDAVQKVAPQYKISDRIGGGYVNWAAGWVDAEAGVRFAKHELDQMHNVIFRTAEVSRLLYEDQGDIQGTKSHPHQPHTSGVVKGVVLSEGSLMKADLVILATGAWTPTLVDLRGKAEASGQVLAFINITNKEQQELEHMPSILNLGTGMFVIPPRNNVLKIARHAYGYRNPQKVAVPEPLQQDSVEDKVMEISIPESGIPIPLEGEEACRTALGEMLPAFANRPFARTRVCWYTDT